MSRLRRRLLIDAFTWVNNAALVYGISSKYIIDAQNQSEYTFVSYIHCNSTHYIDTGYIPTSKTGMMLYASNINGSTDTNFAGCRISSGSRFMINSYQYNYVTYGYNEWNKTKKLYLNLTTDVINTITLNYKNDRMFRCNDQLITITESFNEIGYSIYIGAQNGSGTAGTSIEHDVNGFIITEETECKHFFLPCVRNVDNVSGMYDIISKQFFTNPNNSNFTYSDKITLKEKIDSILKKLDNTFILYDYMESTGTQYIDTGLTVTKSTGTLEIKFSPTAITGTTYVGNVYNGVIGLNSSPQIGWYTEGWTVGNAGSSIPYIPEVGTIYTATWGYDTNEHLYIDGKDTELSRTGTLTAKICSVANGPENCKVKVYYCKITDTNGNVTHYLVPAVYGGITGMYDNINNVFYSNAGTGDFIMGNKIELT